MLGARCPLPGAARPVGMGAGSPGSAAGAGPARLGPVAVRSGRCRTLPCPLGSRGAAARRGPTSVRPPRCPAGGRERPGSSRSVSPFPKARASGRWQRCGLTESWEAEPCMSVPLARVMNLSAARFEAARFQLRSKSLGLTCDFRGVSKRVRQVHSLLTDDTSQRLALQPWEPASPALGVWPWCGYSCLFTCLSARV
ncbi:uncharacterized protein [Taeniopygia guttata]|uniref:uncharacterized protein isoform X2 n=1 Tax=Taeniopygia guttata TaxID=59729 RepID=UPI003BB913FA